jgi:hypothetical protein
VNDTETSTWLPTTNQIIMASERAILAALDTQLLLAARTLEAEHASSLSEDALAEPPPPHLALAQSILILAASLRELIAGYRAATEHILGDG